MRCRTKSAKLFANATRRSWFNYCEKLFYIPHLREADNVYKTKIKGDFEQSCFNQCEQSCFDQIEQSFSNTANNHFIIIICRLLDRASILKFLKNVECQKIKPQESFCRLFMENFMKIEFFH